MKTKNNHSKYVAIVLVVILVITAALLFVEVWEKKQGRYSGSILEDDILEYEDKEYVLKDNIETFLVLGLDKFDGAISADSHESGIQSDFLMLFVLNNETKQCEALHINRDTMTNVNRLGIDGTKIDSFTKQIALAYNYVYDNSGKISCRNTSDAVEDLLLGVDVDHYVSLTLDSVKIILERTPPELSADIFRRGIYLTGGASQVNHLAELIAKGTGLKVNVSENPVTGVALGISKIIKDDNYKSVASLEGMSR